MGKTSRGDRLHLSCLIFTDEGNMHAFSSARWNRAPGKPVCGEYYRASSLNPQIMFQSHKKEPLLVAKLESMLFSQHPAPGTLCLFFFFFSRLWLPTPAVALGRLTGGLATVLPEQGCRHKGPGTTNSKFPGRNVCKWGTGVSLGRQGCCKGPASTWETQCVVFVEWVQWHRGLAFGLSKAGSERPG